MVSANPSDATAEPPADGKRYLAGTVTTYIFSAVYLKLTPVGFTDFEEDPQARKKLFEKFGDLIVGPGKVGRMGGRVLSDTVLNLIDEAISNKCHYADQTPCFAAQQTADGRPSLKVCLLWHCRTTNPTSTSIPTHFLRKSSSPRRRARPLCTLAG